LRVSLVGVSCVGTTTIGRILADRCGCPFFDLDEEVERHFGLSIERLQARFLTGYSDRKECAAVLERVATANPDCVIALPPSGLRDAFLRVVRRVPGVTVAVRDTPENTLERITFYDTDSRRIDKHHPARGDPMTAHYQWETTLDERRRADPGIDDPARRAAARKIRDARDIGYHLAQMRKQRGITQAEVPGRWGSARPGYPGWSTATSSGCRSNRSPPTSRPSAATCAWSPTSTRPPRHSSTTPTRSLPERPGPGLARRLNSSFLAGAFEEL
jgi:shikimate kinase